MLSAWSPEFVFRRPVGWRVVEAAKPNLDLVIGIMSAEQGRAAIQAEMAMVGCPRPASRLAGDRDVATVPDSEGHERAASLLAARQAVAQTDPHRLATSLEPDSAAAAAALSHIPHRIHTNDIVGAA